MLVEVSASAVWRMASAHGLSVWGVRVPPTLVPRTAKEIMEDEIICHIANNLVIPMEGFAVVCHGLVSVPHLNGELGDVGEHDDDTEIRLAVHFELSRLGSWVKPENLCIVFELPIKD